MREDCKCGKDAMLAERDLAIRDRDRLIADMLATLNEANRGFSVHPKLCRDYYSRATNLGVDLTRRQREDSHG